MTVKEQFYLAGFIVVSLFQLAMSLLFIEDARKYKSSGENVAAVGYAAISAASVLSAIICAFSAINLIVESQP